MGAQIAAHLANAGVPVLLLDLTRGRRARRAEARARAEARPVLHARRRRADHHRRASTPTSTASPTADWIIEAVVERLDVKRALFERRRRRPPRRARSSPRTRPGIPIAALAEGRSDDFRRHLLGTHFFNPPRYLHLLELIPTPDTDPAVVDRVARVRRSPPRQRRRRREGHAELHRQSHRRSSACMQVLRALESGELHDRGDRRDHRPGASGRPKSATFRTMDIAGLDVLGHVARNLARAAARRRGAARFALPPLVDALIERGWVGEKAGQGSTSGRGRRRRTS